MKSRRSMFAGLAAVLAVNWAAPSPGPAQGPVEVVYATFLDPSSRNDPRAAAQTKMIEAFEQANPDIKV
jgi:multiple sugar transport system substrate-binding protein